jgi:hypothetical protein
MTRTLHVEMLYKSHKMRKLPPYLGVFGTQSTTQIIDTFLMEVELTWKAGVASDPSTSLPVVLP